MSHKILIVEDDQMMLSLLQFKLQREGFETIVVQDGNEAIAKIENDSPDLIVTDIMMPFLNGMELTSKIRNELNLKTPIIVISSAGQEDMVMQAFKLGADNFITKPFSPNELVMRIRKLLNLI